ncbi:MAG: GtrA family protein [Tidjanibacter sp.]|nr:GtrA family protein [Tidjanibacter sp.]
MNLAKSITKFIDLFYIKPVARLIPQQMFRYAACGSGNLVLNWVLYFVLYHWVICERFIDLGFVVVSPHIATFILTFPVTFFTGYWLQSRISFRNSPLSEGTQLFRYALSVLGSIVINYAGLKLFVEILHIYPTPSQILSSLVTVLYSYVAQKYFTFRGSKE